MANITLDVGQTILKGHAAYQAGNLQALHDRNGGCQYRDETGCPCVVGAGLSDDEAVLIEEWGLNDDPLESTLGSDDAWGVVLTGVGIPEGQGRSTDTMGFKVLERLQTLHDNCLARAMQTTTQIEARIQRLGQALDLAKSWVEGGPYPHAIFERDFGPIEDLH